MTIKTNCDVLKARLMARFYDMDRDDLINLWNEHNEDDRIEDIDDIDGFFEGACQSDMAQFLNAVYRGNSIGNWPDAEYFTVNAYGNVVFLQDYDDDASPFNAEVLAGKLLDAGDALVDEVRDELIDEAHADAESWDDGDDASPAAYLCALFAMTPTSADEACAIADDYAAWAASRTLTADEKKSFRRFFRELAELTGTRDKFAAMGII